ncbi:MAG: hypothetical protein QOE35_105, partial [Actinomycetota bacterium]
MSQETTPAAHETFVSDTQQPLRSVRRPGNHKEISMTTIDQS